LGSGGILVLVVLGVVLMREWIPVISGRRKD
jgi:hypothetical protein